MYEVVNYNSLNLNSVTFENIAKELNLSIDHVKSYFLNYDIYKKYPIRDLTFEEEQLVQAIKEVKLMGDNQLKTLLEDYEITMEDLQKDQLLIERKMSRYNDDNSYALTRKYQHFILEPAVLYGNKEAAITRPLDMENIVTLLSNIALGLIDQKEEIDPKVRISALSKIADIYTTSKMLSVNTDTTITSEDLNDLSPKELTRLINHIKVNKEEDSKPQELNVESAIQKQETLREFILFD